METSILFPKDRESLEEAIKAAMAASDSVCNIKAIEWWISHYYMLGVRDFPYVNYRDGVVQVRYSSVKNQRGFRYGEVITRYTREMGRLIRMDISPKVRPLGMTLDGLRGASISQVVLSSLFSPSYLEHVKTQFLRNILVFGTGGIGGWMVKKGGKTRYILESIPPWELLPIPADAISDEEVRGLIRTRWVSLEWLKQSLNSQLDKPSKRLPSDIETIKVTYGSMVRQEGSPGGTSDASGFQTNIQSEKTSHELTSAGKEKTDKLQEYVRLVEMWLFDNFRKVNRYVVMAGGKVFEDKSMEGDGQYPLPIGVARYYDSGGFYGQGYVTPLIPLNSEVEAMLVNLFKNVQDLDNYGILMLPTTLGLSRQELNAKRRPKAVFFEPDITSPDVKPFALEPVNAGRLPGQVAEMGISLIGALSGQSEMLTGGAPGRVDSAAGLGYLSEQSSIPLGGPSSSIASAFADVYTSILHSAGKEMSQNQITSYVFLDDALAGVALQQDGTISLTANAIPDPNEVEITIRSQYPESQEQKKQELMALMEKQIITPQEFRIQSRILNLDLPVANEAEWESYRQSVLNNIILFNDGETPGEITMGEHEMHMMHLQRLTSFMSKPEYQLASPEVRRAFEKALEARRQMMQVGAFPDQLPNPEDLEEEERMLQKRMMQMQAQGGPIPPGMQGPLM